VDSTIVRWRCGIRRGQDGGIGGCGAEEEGAASRGAGFALGEVQCVAVDVEVPMKMKMTWSMTTQKYLLIICTISFWESQEASNSEYGILIFLSIQDHVCLLHIQWQLHFYLLALVALGTHCQ
jgi:hypothetical protein